MEVAILTTAQARHLYKRFGHWFEIRPEPAKGDRWYIKRTSALALKEWFIDKFPVDHPKRAKALEIWDAIKDLPRYELDDYPQYLYDQKDETELAEYAARFADLEFENVA